MLTLPEAILPVLIPFATLFRGPTWRKAQVLLVGAVLAPGQRTVASALRVMGLSGDRNYARYHHVLNRAAWSPLKVSQVLLVLLIRHLYRGDGPLIFGIDETLERRRGPQISALGVYRDAVRSSCSYLVKASGLRWVSLMWLGHIPWAGRCPSSPCWRPQNVITRGGDALTRNSPTGPARWSCNCAAGCPDAPWCWWGIAATQSWTCSTSANPCGNRSPSSPDCAWMPDFMPRLRLADQAKTAVPG